MASRIKAKTSSSTTYLSMKDVVKNKLLNEMFGSLPDNNRKVLIVDEYALSILSASCQTHEILEKNIMLVENLLLKRQPLPKFPAVYFMAPTPASVDKFIEDWKEPSKPLYAYCYIFFTARLDDSLLRKIKDSPAIGKIKMCSDVYTDFLAIESQTFSLDMDDDIRSLYATNVSDAYTSMLADKLATVCITLKEYPYVRYSKSHPISATVASKLQDRLDELRGALNGYDYRRGADRGTLIITDRSLDMIAPIIHEFTYQAMVYDLLGIQKDNIYTQTYTNSKGVQSERKVILDENDKIWVRFRHAHIADAVDKLASEFKSFVAQNKAAALDRNQKIDDLKEMSEAVRAMPKFTELKNKYSLHLDIAKRLMDIFKEQLSPVAMFEQTLATGLNEDGEKPKKPLYALTQLIKNADRNIRLRLALLYVIFKDGMDEQEKLDLFQNCELNMEERDMINKLACFGVNVNKVNKGLMARFKGGSSKKQYCPEEQPEFPKYAALSRYSPVLRDVTRAHLTSKLPTADFPYVADVPTESESTNSRSTREADSSDKSTSKSVRTRAKWNKGKHTNTEDENKNDDSTAVKGSSFEGSRLIIFLCGGATFSELRNAYVLSQSFNKEILIGSTSVLTPNNFIQELKMIDNN